MDILHYTSMDILHYTACMDILHYTPKMDSKLQLHTEWRRWAICMYLWPQCKSILTPMMALSSLVVTCLALSTAAATCCWCWAWRRGVRKWNNMGGRGGREQVVERYEGINLLGEKWNNLSTDGIQPFSNLGLVPKKKNSWWKQRATYYVLTYLFMHFDIESIRHLIVLQCLRENSNNFHSK